MLRLCTWRSEAQWGYKIAHSATRYRKHLKKSNVQGQVQEMADARLVKTLATQVQAIVSHCQTHCTIYWHISLIGFLQIKRKCVTALMLCLHKPVTNAVDHSKQKGCI